MMMNPSISKGGGGVLECYETPGLCFLLFFLRLQGGGGGAAAVMLKGRGDNWSWLF